jgi:hypothetical protein
MMDQTTQVQQWLDSPQFLEADLLSFDLRDKVESLLEDRASARMDDLRRFLGPALSSILQGGLTKLPRTMLSGLIEEPLQLIALQELILCDGGLYWERYKSIAPAYPSRRRVGVEMARVGLQVTLPETKPIPRLKEKPGALAGLWVRRLGVLLTLAAAILVTVLGMSRSWNGQMEEALDAKERAEKRAKDQGMTRDADTMTLVQLICSAKDYMEDGNRKAAVSDARAALFLDPTNVAVEDLLNAIEAGS